MLDRTVVRFFGVRREITCGQLSIRAMISKAFTTYAKSRAAAIAAIAVFDILVFILAFHNTLPGDVRRHCYRAAILLIRFLNVYAVFRFPIKIQNRNN